MKIWNNPELEELEIKLTANGETESDTESSATDVAVMCFGGGYWWHGGGHGGGNRWDDDDCTKPTEPDCGGGDGEGNDGDYPIPGES